MKSTVFPSTMGASEVIREAKNIQLEQLIDNHNKRFDIDLQKDVVLELEAYFKARVLPHVDPKELSKELTKHLIDRKSRFKFLKSKGSDVHIGIDTEYEYDEKNNCNNILSYQYCLMVSELTAA